MNHSELGDTYLTLLEAVEQTALSEAEVVLHSEEVWMYCPKVSKKEQLIKDTEADVVSNWIGMKTARVKWNCQFLQNLQIYSKSSFTSA